MVCYLFIFFKKKTFIFIFFEAMTYDLPMTILCLLWHKQSRTLRAQNDKKYKTMMMLLNLSFSLVCLLLFVNGSTSISTEADRSNYEREQQTQLKKMKQQKFVRSRQRQQKQRKTQTYTTNLQEQSQTLLSSSSSSSPTPLEFIHITKTGGSSVEKAAWSGAGIKWGVCHFQVDHMIGCNTPDYPVETYFREGGTEPWHIPIQFHSKPSYVENKRTFAIVRNPYERMISEYYSKWGGLMSGHVDRENVDINDRTVMNRFLMGKATQKERHATHYRPQHEYIYDENGRKIVDHVLRFENIQEEFPKLMALYGLENKVVLESGGRTNAAENKRLGFQDLDVETVQAINRLYQKDFELLGYEMVHSI